MQTDITNINVETINIFPYPRKPVYIEKYDGAVIRWVTTHTKRVGVDWSLTVQAHIETSKKVTKIDGVLSIALQVEGKQMLKKWKQVNVETKADGTVVEEIELLISGVRTILLNNFYQ